jgi:hypothetical protein
MKFMQGVLKKLSPAGILMGKQNLLRAELERTSVLQQSIAWPERDNITRHSSNVITVLNTLNRCGRGSKNMKIYD